MVVITVYSTYWAMQDFYHQQQHGIVRPNGPSWMADKQIIVQGTTQPRRWFCTHLFNAGILQQYCNMSAERVVVLLRSSFQATQKGPDGRKATFTVRLPEVRLSVSGHQPKRKLLDLQPHETRILKCSTHSPRWNAAVSAEIPSKAPSWVHVRQGTPLTSMLIKTIGASIRPTSGKVWGWCILRLQCRFSGSDK